MLYAYLIVIRYIIYVEYYMHDETHFLFWIDHPKTCVIWSSTELYSLISFLNFSNKDLVEPDTKQVSEDKQQCI